MRIFEDEAARYDAISLSSFDTINKGLMTLADDDTGEVAYTDKTGNVVVVPALGPHSIRLMLRRR